MPNEIPKKILDATLEVIAREKISGTRMHHIAAEAGMTQSNLHYYFPTKNDILIALLDEIQNWFSENRKGTVDPAQKGFTENLHALFREKQDVILNNKKLDYVQFDYWVQGTVNPNVKSTFKNTFDIWRRDIGAVLSQNTSSGSQNPERLRMLPYLMVSLMMGASMQYLMDEEQMDLDEYFKAAEKMVLNFMSESKS